MADLRRPFFVAALVLIALVVLLELGATAFLPSPTSNPAALSSSIPADDKEFTPTSRPRSG